MLIVDNSCVCNDFVLSNVQNSFFSIASIWKRYSYSPSPTPVKYIALIYLACLLQYKQAELKGDYLQREGTVFLSIGDRRRSSGLTLHLIQNVSRGQPDIRKVVASP